MFSSKTSTSIIASSSAGSNGHLMDHQSLPKPIFSLSPKEKCILALRIFCCWFCVLAIVVHIYIAIWHTAGSNGAVVNINHIINSAMCFIVLCKQVNNFNENFIIESITCEGRKKRVHFARRIIVIMIVSVVVIHLAMLIAYYGFAGFDDFSALFFGVQLKTIVQSDILHYSLITLSFVQVTLTLAILMMFMVRYSVIHFALGIYVNEASCFLKSFIQLGKGRFNDGSIFSQIEHSIQFYNSSVAKINDQLNLIPLWLLTVVYCSFVSGITVIVMTNGDISATFSFLSLGINLLEMAFAAIIVTKLVSDANDKMALYRSQVVSMVADSIKSVKSCKQEKSVLTANRNSLKFVLSNSPISQSFVGNLYPLNFALIFSIISSTISLTVMVITTLKSLKPAN